jgi:tetratricopeptide (TPR) repeat protein
MNSKFIADKKGCIFRIHFLCLLLLSLLFSGCSYHDNNFSYFNMLDTEKRTLKNKRAAQKFWSSVRPVTTLSSSHYKLGRYYQKQGKYSKAIDEFSKALKNDSNFCKAYNGIAMSYDALRSCEMAHETYDLAIECAPQEAYLYNNYACSSLLCGEYQKGISLLTKAGNLSEDNNRIKNNLKFAHSIYDQISNPGSIGTKEVRVAQVDQLRISLPEDRDLKSASIPIHEISRLDAKEAATPNIDVSELVNADSNEKKNNIQIVEINSRVENENVLKRDIASSVDFESPIGKIVPDRTKKVVAQKYLRHSVNFSTGAIEVSNGNGVIGMAGRSADYFRGLGFTVGRITNAKDFQFEESVILYREGHLQLAKELATVLPGAQNIEKAGSFERATIGVKILLGKDMVSMQFPQGYALNPDNSGFEKTNLITSTINVEKLPLVSSVLSASI